MPNLETIDPLSLPSVALDDFRALPRSSGMYFAIDVLNNIQYVGISGDIAKRWRDHHHYNCLVNMGCVRLAYWLCDDKQKLARLEKVLINQFQPPLNKIFREPISCIESGGIKLKVAEVRKQRGVSQNELARLMDMSVAGVRNLEWTVRSINFETLDRLCKSLECVPADLFEYIPDDETAA